MDMNKRYFEIEFDNEPRGRVWDENCVGDYSICIIGKCEPSFEEAEQFCKSDMEKYAILFDDPDHSEEEDRFLIIGMTDRKGVCIVSHCYRGEDEKIRIISARKATKTEQNVYNEQPFWR